MTHLHNKLWLVIMTYLHPGIAYKALCPLNISCLALLCIHAVTQIHIQTSGLWGTLMEAVQSTTYCPVCLKCSTRQTALRPQMWEWKQSSATLPTFSPSLTSILVLSSPISITFSLINHPPLHPSILLPLSREEKQTAVRVRLADEFQMTLKGRGADQLSPEGRAATTRVHVDENKHANSIK